MTDTTSQERIIRKMRKLLAMSESTANENEALIAAKQLHAMLAKHNLSAVDLEEQPDVGKESIEEHRRPWKRILAYSIAKLYFCDLYVTTGYHKTKCKYVFLGSEANRAFAIHIFKMVLKTIEREASRECRAHHGKRNQRFLNSFGNGASYRVGERCRELIRAAREGTLEDDTGNTLPALLDTYDSAQEMIDAFLKAQGVSLKVKVHKDRSSDYAGVRAGRATGDKVTLSRTLQGNSAPKQIG